MNRMIMILGAASVGKTSVIRWLVPYLKENLIKPCLCKIDCLYTNDSETYQKLNVPHVVGLSGDICPDHFLVSNLCELWNWKEEQQCDSLIIETAGLCSRCCPATEHTLSVCVLDATASTHSAKKLGPMVTLSDFIVLTKIDMVSQAEREILIHSLSQLNPGAKIFPVDGLVGYGVESLGHAILSAPPVDVYDGDMLRHTMPSGVCSYCIGEKRVGSAFQQGVVGKIHFESGVSS